MNKRTWLAAWVGVVLLAVAAGAQTTRRAAATARVNLEGVEVRYDVTYLAPDREEKLDLYLPKGREKGVRSPAVVMIHGGGWVGGDKGAARERNVGAMLARLGYVCASVNYQMKEGERWPTNLLDCKNAVRFLRARAEEYGVDPERIGVMGGSAGGHLALMVGYTSDVKELEPEDGPYPGVSDRVSAVVDLYGITNIVTRRNTDPQGNPIGEPRPKTALFPQGREGNEALWRLASPVYHVKKGSPPTLILHGTADTTVARDQATELETKLKEAGVEHRLVMVEGVGHSFDLEKWKGKPLPVDVKGMVVEFLGKYVKGEGKE